MGQESTAHRRPGVSRNAGERQNGSLQDGARPEGGGTADLPEDVAGLGAIGKRDGAAGSRGQRRACLKDEHCAGVALPIQRQVAVHRQGAGRIVDARHEGLPAQGPTGNGRAARAGRRISIRVVHVDLCLRRGGVRDVDRSGHGAGREPSHGCPRCESEIADERRICSIGRGGPGQHCEGRSGSQGHGLRAGRQRASIGQHPDQRTCQDRAQNSAPTTFDIRVQPATPLSASHS